MSGKAFCTASNNGDEMFDESNFRCRRDVEQTSFFFFHNLCAAQGNLSWLFRNARAHPIVNPAEGSKRISLPTDDTAVSWNRRLILNVLSRHSISHWQFVSITEPRDRFARKLCRFFAKFPRSVSDLDVSRGPLGACERNIKST